MSGENRRCRLPRANRLLDEKAYSRVFKKAGRSRDLLFTVLYRSRDAGVNSPGVEPTDFDNRAPQATNARLGLAISKKNCRLAVGRNRIKRIVRESFRRHQHALTGLDVIVLNKLKTHNASNRALVDSLEAHWRHCRTPTNERAG